MLKFTAAPFVRTLHLLGVMRGAFTSIPAQFGPGADTAPVLPDIKPQALSSLREIQQHLAILNAPMTRLAVARFVNQLEHSDGLTYDHFNTMVEDIHSRLHDELGLNHLFVLDAKHAAYFDAADLGETLLAKFPTDLGYELTEAGKCLALDRSTAAVFHSRLRSLPHGRSRRVRQRQVRRPHRALRRARPRQPPARRTIARENS